MTNQEPLFAAEAILRATGGKPLRGGSRWSCGGFSTDTRSMAAGNLFIALTGENFDGHDCLKAAADKGASGLLIGLDHRDKLDEIDSALPAIGVPDTMRALGDIAHAWRKRFSLPVVAITGSAGKTTTKEMLAAIASRTRTILKTEGNRNNLIGLPLTLLQLRKEHEFAIVEMGTNQPGEIARLAAIAAPDVGIITNIGPAHLEGLVSMEGIREEKGGLFNVMAGRGTAVINGDDPAIGILAERWPGRRITFGLGAGADVTARGVEHAGPGGIRFNLLIEGIGIRVLLRSPGEHNVLNALAAAAAAWVLGFDRNLIAEGLDAFSPVPGRTEIRQLGNGAHMILDTYNANPASMREAIKTLQGLRGQGRAFAILGDMLELGERAEELHEEIGQSVPEAGMDHLFLKGILSRFTAAGAVKKGLPGERVTLFDDPQTVVADLKSRLRKGDWILIKGSRKMKLEKVAEALIAAFDLKP